MKKYILSFFFTLASFCSFGQLVISQVYEGVNNNKWIEITNTGLSDVNLSSPIQYKVGIWQSAGSTGNGTISGAPSSFINLTGTLIKGQKYLIRNSNAATNVPHAIMPSANDSNTTVAAFDGNDALAIYTASDSIVDAFGVGINYNDVSYLRNSWVVNSKSTYFSSDWLVKTLAQIASPSSTTDWIDDYNDYNSAIGTHYFNGYYSFFSVNSIPSLNSIYSNPSATTSFVFNRLQSNLIIPMPPGVIPPPPGFCGNTLITTPIGFEISTVSNFSSNVGTNTISMIISGCSVFSKTVYIRLASNNSVGNYSGNVSFAFGTDVYNLPTDLINTVNPKQLNISGITANDKQYNGTTLTTLTGTPILNGVLPSQVANVTLEGSPIANFNDELPGNDKPVTVTGYTISGSAASNYVVLQPSGLTASIFPNTTVVNLKLFIEGYYSGGNTMTIANANRGVTSILNSVDDIEVELRNTTTFLPIATTSAMLNVDGTAICTFNSTINGLYYIVVKGSNIIQTWSANPVLITSNPITYDYTTSMSKAYGNNMIELEPGIFGIYSGDINQDGTIDGSDVVDLYNDIESSAFGDLITDLNGDGVVDNSDLPIFENNLSRSIFSDHP